MRFGDWVAVFVERFEVEDNSFADQFFHFGFCIYGGDTTGQIRDVGGVAVVGSFDEDGVFHSDSPHEPYLVSNFWHSHLRFCLPPHPPCRPCGLRPQLFDLWISAGSKQIGKWETMNLPTVSAAKCFGKQDFERVVTSYFQIRATVWTRHVVSKRIP